MRPLLLQVVRLESQLGQLAHLSACYRGWERYVAREIARYRWHSLRKRHAFLLQTILMQLT